ncbi:Serine-threonine protein kinase [Entamoeba marina]
MFKLIYTFTLFCVVIALCGDGIRDVFSEECDGVDYCSESCKCQEGYDISETDNICIPTCDIVGCIGDCIQSNECIKCNTSLGYAEDCHSCLEGYYYQGYLKCVEVTDDVISSVSSCQQVLDNDSLSYERNITVILGETIGVDIKATDAILSADVCFDRVMPSHPYSPGYWFELNAEEECYVILETGQKFSNYLVNFYHLQETNVGVDTQVAIHTSCYSDINDMPMDYCESTSDNIDQYVKSTTAITHLTAGESRYVFVNMPFGEQFTEDLTIYFTAAPHICGVVNEEILWNDLLSGEFTTSISSDEMHFSDTSCDQFTKKGKWYYVRGIDQSISISTCDSPSYIESSISVIAVDNNETVSIDTVCSDTSTECVGVGQMSCSDGSRNSMITVELTNTKDYLIFVSTYQEDSIFVQLSVKPICPMNCGENGVCSASVGGCVCLNGYIRSGEVCTLCGNGVIDAGEECDSSDGITDSHCDDTTCMCDYGYYPTEIDGVTKCALSSCGNGEIDYAEECDGGEGCDHCVYSGEECDGGDGCYECECQDGYFPQSSKSCTTFNRVTFVASTFSGAALFYFLFWVTLLIIISLISIKVNKSIKEEWSRQTNMSFVESVIIPFNKTNSQYIDIKTNDTFFAFDPPFINFPEIGNRPEVDEPAQTTFILKNNYVEPLYFTFHCGEYLKYDLLFSPVVGTVKPKETITISVNLLVKCTTILHERIPVTFRFGKVQHVMKEIERNNPEMLNINSSQNSESTEHKYSSNGSVNSKDKLSSHRTGTHESSDKGSDVSTKKSHEKHKNVRKFHVYLPLNIESALSTKIDYEEVNLIHPPIGSGTFGIVYRADWRKVDVAVKVMKTDLVDMNELLPNFTQEAEMMERIRCPYIVNYIGSVITSDTLCLVTEFCPLGSLRKYMKTNAFSDFLQLRFCQDIARGMEYLHQNDILHRDLKTDNVLVYSSNPFDPITAKVTDFGTSRSFIESSGKIALQNIGTPMYMAPEIFQSEQMTLKSDIFSFSICMLEILIGKEPYDTMKFPDSESILKFVCSGKRLEVGDSCLLKKEIEACWRQKPAERPTFKEVGLSIQSLIASTREKDSKTKTGSGSNKTHITETNSVLDVSAHAEESQQHISTYSKSSESISSESSSSLDTSSNKD